MLRFVDTLEHIGQIRFKHTMDIKALLATPPPPVVDAKNKLVLLWSHKSGCTFAVKWILSHMGLFEKTRGHVHDYRCEQLYASDEHKEAIEDYCRSPSSYRVIRVIRQPFKRAVSSYIHASVFGYEDGEISQFLNRPVDAVSRFSFREFVRYLENIDVKTCNLHHRLQTHPLERQLVHGTRFLINLDYSMQSLPKLERFLGLSQTDPSRYRESRHHTRTSSVSSDAVTSFCADTCFEIYGDTGPLVPDYRSFYDADLEQQVFGVYAEDFLRYGFPTSVFNEHA